MGREVPWFSTVRILGNTLVFEYGDGDGDGDLGKGASGFGVI